MNTLRTQKGFTIVETLVAITILMIAIAGPLSIASKGLTGALASRDQMIASYLAQESMEVIKNIRDNNLDAGSDWLNGFLSCDNIGPVRYCDASAIDSPTIKTGFSTYPLKITGDNYYSHESTGRATPFSRHFYFSEPGSATTACASDIECTVTVVVTWRQGTVPYQVTLSSQLLNASR